jgi:hypothetical protein
MFAPGTRRPAKRAVKLLREPEIESRNGEWLWKGFSPRRLRRELKERIKRRVPRMNDAGSRRGRDRRLLSGMIRRSASGEGLYHVRSTCFGLLESVKLLI